VSSGDTDVTTARLEQQARVEMGVAVTLCGTYRHHIDDKGRVAIPAQLRRLLPEGSVVAPGPESRLMIYPPSEWAVQKDLFLRTAETPAQERRFMRLLTGNSSLFEVDTQGRLLLSAQQRTFAQIVDQVVFVGIGSGVEIVADELWRSEEAALSPAEFTQVWDLVHQRGTSASPSPA
jgi:MraZ protein